MDYRKVETRLARFTLGALVVYVPAETWVSLNGGLLHPMYIVDVIAMLLLFVAARASLKAGPDSRAGLLAGAWGWAAANGWRATSWRTLELSAGGSLDYGHPELWATGLATAVALACFGLSFRLAYGSTVATPRTDSDRDSAGR